ncbi:E3 ubiquitin-protein ligase RNF185 isoform X2 [Saccopteryx leptura]|uniref:E3 ubiquitin-protein ligase RNF185 isoform X2 n=1 Tax=Saccopteryx leptura TaxID=249018 RepID=UPI00339CD671
MASKGPSASASPENSSAGGPSGSSNGAGESGGQDSTFECNICLDTAKDAVISLCGHLFCGWRPDLTDRCVQFAKLGSAETRSSHSMAGAALDSRIPGSHAGMENGRGHERRPLPVLKDRGQSRRTEGDFKDLDLEMVASRCLLELGHFPLGYLPQHLT